MKGLTTKQLNYILSRGVTKQYFKGTFASDQDFENFKTPFCVVSNVQGHTKSGDHWVAFFVYKDVMYYFDTFGRPATNVAFPQVFGQFSKTRKCFYNPRIVQGLFSETCGVYCIFVLRQLSENVSWRKILKSFSNIPSQNDDVMRKYFRKNC